MPNTANVTTGKPQVAGAIFIAPAGTTLPTDATTALSGSFVELGYASEDGLKNNHASNSEKYRAWGGDVVMILNNEVEDQFSLTLIEAVKADVLKLIHGDSNVSGALSSGLSVAVNGDDAEEHVWVFDLIYRNDTVKRIVIPRGIISEVGEVSYTDSDAVGYPITIDALPDTSGNTHYEYIKGPVGATGGTGA